jgi:hypothetical protein
LIASVSPPPDGSIGLPTFILGAIAGGIAGIVAGMMVMRAAGRIASAVSAARSRRLRMPSRDRPSFELLQQ